MRERDRRVVEAADLEPRGELLRELFAIHRLKDHWPRARQLAGERVAVGAEETNEIDVPEAEVTAFRPVVDDLPGVRPVMDRLEVDLAEARDVLRRVKEPALLQPSLGSH